MAKETLVQKQFELLLEASWRCFT